MRDINVGAFEKCFGSIQDIDCQNVTRQPYNCSSKVKI